MTVLILIFIGIAIIFLSAYEMWFKIRSERVLKFRKELRQVIYDKYLNSEYKLSEIFQMINLDDPDRNLDAMIYSFRPLTFEEWLDAPELYILFPDKYPEYINCL